ncbi:cysteine desulfurase [Streptococcus sp. NLN76]|uniref:cysteine desulfurase n=1 Tax=Streptococcus sp. NLN76 TaxID=2822800 RepID=UPI001B3551DF|nr:cysteine desulfurase [Streptococcus sp. NLN76]
MQPIDGRQIQKDFPILDQQVHDEDLVYLDSAATSQKPCAVIEAMDRYYQEINANVHRGVHSLGESATQAYEEARRKVASFIGAASEREVIFTRGTTTGLNHLARMLEPQLSPGDEVLISIMEHHSNIVPWQQVCQRTGAKLVYVYLKDGRLDLDDVKAKLNPATQVVSLAHVSNVLGIENPIAEIADWVHDVGAYLVVDGAQSVPHLPVDVQQLDLDFLVFSGHKMMGPTGIGVLYGKESHLKELEPVEFGGEMIDFVFEQESTWTDLPWKLEAGTPPIAEAIGLGAAVDYLNDLGMDRLAAQDKDLLAYLWRGLQSVEGVEIYGPPSLEGRTGLISFNLEGLHPHDVATALDYEGVAVRAGHHCAQPLLFYLGVGATLRASLYAYNTKEDCDRLVQALEKTKEFFNGTF